MNNKCTEKNEEKIRKSEIMTWKNSNSLNKLNNYKNMIG